ncbi:MAG: O-antigen ligase [Lachnospira sp.]|nr:O-antigen ligase [Lachnospira sp.]
MILILLTAVTSGFLFVNYYLGRKDIFAPGFLFCLVFFIGELVCLINVSTFAIELHAITLFVISFGLTGFTLISFIYYRFGGSGEFTRADIQPILISNAVFVVLIILQLATITGFVFYLRNLMIAYQELYGKTVTWGLTNQISLYDTLTKFQQTEFNNLSSVVSLPYIWRIGNPICYSCEYLTLYILINNRVAKYKLNLLQICVIILMVIRIIINGSRSPVLRIVTAALTIFIVLNYRSADTSRKNQMKIVVEIIIVLALTGAAMIGLLFAMGREGKVGAPRTYLFIYTGAPIVNLDHFLQEFPYGFLTGNSGSVYFGAQTFRSLYNYIGKLFHIESLQFQGVLPFMYSNNGIEIGNVFTMFQNPIYDFGFIGSFLSTAGMGAYYVAAGSGVKMKPNIKQRVDYRLLIYAYLINDLVMSVFSCRFYETVLDAPFLKFAVLTWLVDKLLLERHKKSRKICS